MRRGLGLALVAQVVARRRGRIAVENVDGALFTVALPLHETRIAATELEHVSS